MMRRSVIGVAVLGLIAAGCGGGVHAAAPTSTEPPTSATTAPAPTTLPAPTTTTTAPPLPASLGVWLKSEEGDIKKALRAYSAQDSIQPVADAAQKYTDSIGSQPWTVDMSLNVTELKSALNDLAGDLDDSELPSQIRTLNTANADLGRMLSMTTATLTTPTTVAPTITLKITASGASEASDITYDIDGQETQHNDVPLPWSVTIPYTDQQIIVLEGQMDGGSSSSSIKCSIEETGAPAQTGTSTGPYSIAQCTDG